jgi:Na+-transporting NADH:ubiquinone oxidoreductase subunit A
MGRIHMIRKGLNLPIKGQPNQQVVDARVAERVAVIADDFPFMKAKMLVNEGDNVSRGQKLFEDRKNPGVVFTSPGSGQVVAVNRGERRALVSVVIDLNDNEKSDDLQDEDYQAFESYKAGGASAQSAESVRALLIESGLWTTLRARPMSQVPGIESDCNALFVTAIDTNPLAVDVNLALKGKLDDFREGLRAIALLTEGTMFVCQGASSDFSAQVEGIANAQLETFAGDHPAGLVGTHIHTLFPVSRTRTAWHIGYQDVVAIGRLFNTGRLDVERVISFAGPAALKPAILRTRVGAEVAPLIEDRTAMAETRLIDGSVFYGRSMTDNLSTQGFLGRYRVQVTAILEGREREFLGWLKPGGDKFSVTRAFFSPMMSGQFGGGKLFNFNTSKNGSHRAMVPIGLFEKVMPLDMMPTFLLRALLKDDLERAEALGCLELDEEDLALCTFVSPGKEDYGPALRRVLTTIWKEG